MSNKEHYDLKGISILKEIKSNMNKLRLFRDKFNYCWTKDINIKPEWVQGFVDGEGSFQCEISYSKRNKNFPYVNLSLQIKQSNHDVAILYKIKNYFNCGYLKPKYNIKDLKSVLNVNRSTTTLWIRNFDIISNFFDSYPLYTIKRLDYQDWKRLFNLKKLKSYLNKNGLTLMNKIKNNMNSKRIK